MSSARILTSFCNTPKKSHIDCQCIVFKHTMLRVSATIAPKADLLYKSMKHKVIGELQKSVFWSGKKAACKLAMFVLLIIHLYSDNRNHDTLETRLSFTKKFKNKNRCHLSTSRWSFWHCRSHSRWSVSRAFKILVYSIKIAFE